MGKNITYYTRIKNARLTTLQFIILSTLSFSTSAKDYFNPELLYIGNTHQSQVDLDIFSEQGGQSPGTYNVDIYLNNQYIDTQNITFSLIKNNAGTGVLQPCLSDSFLLDIGVKAELLTRANQQGSTCADLARIPYANAELRFSHQQLYLSFPQASITKQPIGYVNEKLWDEGLTAFLLNYNMAAAQNTTSGEDSSSDTNQFMSLLPTLNLGAWRLRNFTSYHKSDNTSARWDSIYTYAQRNIIPLKSQLILGESSSSADVFESVPFSGVALASDENMIPDSLRGYAPVVKGIAQTNAQITIRQNGYVIYQNYVAAGPFEIQDLYPTGGSGNLFVTITEADGRQQQMIVPFASLPILQREGQLKYSLTGGQYRSSRSNVDKKPFTQLTTIYGLPHGFTVYGGGQVASDYHALSSGVGKNMGDIGAISTDFTQAWATPKNQSSISGQSWRIRYSKNFTQTGTDFSIAGYRYTTRNYYDMSEVFDTYSTDPYPGFSYGRKRNRETIQVSQNLGPQAGSLSLNLTNESYWDNRGTIRSIGASYNSSWNQISYGLNYSYNTNTNNLFGNSENNTNVKTYQRDQVFSLNINVPLSIFSSTSYANFSMASSENGGSTYNAGLSGVALAEKNLSWGVQQSYASMNNNYGGNINADYRGTYSKVNTGYAYDKHNQRVNAGLSGSILAHHGGITFGQPTSDTLALLHVADGPGITVVNQIGVKTDGNGYAIVPYATPYRVNQLQLNPDNLPANIELTHTSKTFTPTQGAIVETSFNASVGRRVLMTLHTAQKKPIPFGAIVTASDSSLKMTAIVGDSSTVYLTGMKDHGLLLIQWGNKTDQQCRVTYNLPDDTNRAFISEVSALCQ